MPTECKKKMTEINIYFADVENTDWERAYAEQGSFFEQGRIERIDKCRTQFGRKQLICTGLLIKRVFDLHSVSPKEIVYEKNGKPYLKNRKDFYFNVSNSGKYAVIAVAVVPVGIDIQKSVGFRKKLAERICSEEEINRLGDTLKTKMNLVWAVKEAYTKLTGTGISVDLKTISYDITDDSVTVFDNNNKAAFGRTVFSEDEYETVVLCKEPLTIRNIYYINLQE